MNEAQAYDQLIDLIVRTDIIDLPENTYTTVDRAMIDTLGVTIAGTQEPSARILAGYVSGSGKANGARVIGAGYYANAESAALVNGTALHALDFDDTGAYSQGHPSAPIFPAILALSEEMGCSMDRFASAYVVGVEVLSRLSRSMPMMHLKGWHPTAVIGAIAATAACCNLLRLGHNEVRNALGLAATQAGGLVRSFGSMAKPLHVGQAASLGVRSTLLAEAGMTGNQGILFGEHGFLANFHGDVGERAKEQLKQSGTPWAMINPGINIKRYPCCSLTHRSIDALLLILEESGLTYDQVARVECRVPPRAIKVLFHVRPTDGLQAKFSMQFALACALIHGAVELVHFSSSYILAPTIRSLMERIDVAVHDDWKDGDDSRADVVTIYLHSGQVLRKEVSVPLGNVSRPLSAEAIQAKFRSCVAPVLGRGTAEKCLAWFDSPFNSRDLRNIMDLVSLPPSGLAPSETR